MTKIMTRDPSTSSGHRPSTSSGILVSKITNKVPEPVEGPSIAQKFVVGDAQRYLHTNHKAKGFSLIELLITLTIAGIIAMFAIPSYIQYLDKSRRAEGQTSLLELAAKMERYYTLNHTYATATLSNIGMPASTENSYYQVSLSNLSATTYTLSATPLSTQSNDTLCGTLSIDQSGLKSASGTATDKLKTCW